jgi:hypothetical protein
MEKITVERVVKESRYKALDGEVFINEGDCKDYERTLKCITKAKYNKLIVKHLRESDIVSFANYESYIDVVKLKTKEDIETVTKLLLLHRNYSVESTEELMNDLAKIKEDKEDYLLLYAGNEYDDDSYYGYLGSAKEFLEKAKNSIFDIPKKDVK